MSTMVLIHPIYTVLTGGQDRVTVEGTTIGECLQNFLTKFPQMRQIIFDIDGGLTGIPVISRNDLSVSTEMLADPIRKDDILRIGLVLAGG